MTGGAKKTNAALNVALPADVVTVMSADPAAVAGVINVSVVGEMKVTLAASALPTRTLVSPARKFEPTRVTTSPPAVFPFCGDSEATDGGATYVYEPKPIAGPDAAVIARSTGPKAACGGIVTSSSVDVTYVMSDGATGAPSTVTFVAPATNPVRRTRTMF